MILVVEMDDYNSPQYGKIHRRGCKHVVDPVLMGTATNLVELTNAFRAATGWDDYGPIEVRALLAPCAQAYNAPIVAG